MPNLTSGRRIAPTSVTRAQFLTATERLTGRLSAIADRLATLGEASHAAEVLDAVGMGEAVEALEAMTTERLRAPHRRHGARGRLFPRGRGRRGFSPDQVRVKMGASIVGGPEVGPITDRIVDLPKAPSA